MTKLPISDFLSYYLPHAVRTEARAPDSPPANQWGYVLGAQGQTATNDYIQSLAKANMPGSWQSYAARCAKWLGRKVFDCNSLAEVYYKLKTGVNIDTRARYNYSGWCGQKSPVKADTSMSGLPQMPGVAIFSGPSAASIGHVGFLAEKYGPGDLDWYVLEARGADYGLVLTKLSGRGWQWWGVMDKYFEYGTVQNGNNQSVPITAPTVSALPYYATCSGAGVYIRTGRGTGNPNIGVAKKGDKMLALPAVSGWCAVAAVVNGAIVAGYMSAQYVKAVT